MVEEQSGDVRLGLCDQLKEERMNIDDCREKEGQCLLLLLRIRSAHLRRVQETLTS